MSLHQSCGVPAVQCTSLFPKIKKLQSIHIFSSTYGCFLKLFFNERRMDTDISLLLTKWKRTEYITKSLKRRSHKRKGCPEILLMAPVTHNAPGSLIKIL